MQAKFERVHGHTNARALATGELFTLTSHPREDQNTEYLAVSAEYEVTSQDYEALEGTAADYHCRFSALNSHQPFRAERITPKPMVQGPQTAIIVGPAGETIHTDEFGRVKVQFHWDRYGEERRQELVLDSRVSELGRQRGGAGCSSRTSDRR